MGGGDGEGRAEGEHRAELVLAGGASGVGG